jgi:hypothetical protein
VACNDRGLAWRPQLCLSQKDGETRNHALLWRRVQVSFAAVPNLPASSGKVGLLDSYAVNDIRRNGVALLQDRKIPVSHSNKRRGIELGECPALATAHGYQPLILGRFERVTSSFSDNLRLRCSSFRVAEPHRRRNPLPRVEAIHKVGALFADSLPKGSIGVLEQVGPLCGARQTPVRA